MSKKHKGQTLTIEGKEYPVLERFDVLRHKWEMDGYGFIVMDEGRRRIVLTNHETPRFASHGEMADLIQSIENVVNGMRCAFVSVM